MKKWKQRGFAFVLALSLTTGMLTGAQAAVSKETLNEAVQDTAEYMYRTVQNPQVGSIGGEWAVLGLARSGYDVPDSYYQDYYATVEAYVTACDGKLHDKKYTEYSRVIVALSSIGKDARNVAGYDLTKPLGDYEKTIWQGLNGPIWALIALDSAGYPMPENPEANVQATRQMYIDRILECQLPDGGWSLFGGTEAASSGDGISDPDITGMALQALAKYQDQPEVARATKEALTCMSEQQSDDGGFASWGTANSESCVQMIVALCELGIELDDPRFVKNGNTMLDNLMTFYRQGEGFLHTQSGSGSNQMATEQGFYGLVAAQRAAEGRSSLYRMSDALSIPDAVETEMSGQGQGLEGKDPAVTAQPITSPGKTFPDIAFSDQITAIEALAARGIIDGKSDGNFDPDGSMTRAEFATIVVRALRGRGLHCLVFPLCGRGQHIRPYQRRGRGPVQPGRDYHPAGGGRHGVPRGGAVRTRDGDGYRSCAEYAGAVPGLYELRGVGQGPAGLLLPGGDPEPNGVERPAPGRCDPSRGCSDAFQPSE